MEVEEEDHHQRGRKKRDSMIEGRLVILWPIALIRRTSLLRRRRARARRIKEGKSMSLKKKKEHAYCVEWDSDASASDSDGEKTPSKSLVGITINKKPFIFDTPTCFMTKGPRV
jgi:hypothetical protein